MLNVIFKEHVTLLKIQYVPRERNHLRFYTLKGRFRLVRSRLSEMILSNQCRIMMTFTISWLY